MPATAIEGIKVIPPVELELIAILVVREDFDVVV